ncbi:hypothetical protein KX729_20370 [Rhizobium sp. XQZ8]|uniref:hypothetical protein n=1 Tax=Rhizobium populisoli TaxID=2859785 RepID=UPI001CA5E66F|nr:hypothetical protein [Rhizobium populisoli]MBW6423819.1 hypothetical protein [Rhizobium populisoli]
MKLDNFRAAGRVFLLSLGLLHFLSNIQNAHGEEANVPVIEREALASIKDASVGVLVFGIQAGQFSGFKVLSGSVEDKAAREFENGQGALVSAELAQQLSLHTGDVVTLLNPVGNVTPMGVAPSITRYRVLAIVGDETSYPGVGAVYIRRADAEKFPASGR